MDATEKLLVKCYQVISNCQIYSDSCTNGCSIDTSNLDDLLVDINKALKLQED
jgi:hypothetical protein